MNSNKYVGRYDGTHWGVWDRVKNEWRWYPVKGDIDARAMARYENELLTGRESPRPLPVKVPVKTETKPIQFQPGPYTAPSMPVMSPNMLERLVRMEEDSLASLPLQPLAQPIPGYAATAFLHLKGRN